MSQKTFFYLLAFTCILALNSCTSSSEDATPKKETELPLTEIKDDVYTEYYPERKAIKIQGQIDDNKLRNGKWVFFAENGVELSITHYDHGKKEGHSIVKFPNGMLNYFGEYHEDKKVGIWKKYDENGKMIEESDFGGF